MGIHKIYSAWQRRREVPQIKIQGQWLASAGLSIGRKVRVSIEGDRLIIEPADRAQVLAFPQINLQLEVAA